MERMFSMICSMICWPRMVHWFVRFIGQSFGGTTNFSSSSSPAKASATKFLWWTP